MKRLKEHFDDFVALDSAGGILLIISAFVALTWANVEKESYESFLHLPFSFNFIGLRLDMGFYHFVNDGLMAVFFLMVGAELREELKEGHLSSWDKIVFPLSLAVAGFFLPAFIYLSVNGFSEESMSGWAISTATDIAFALGILSLFSKRVPVGLKVTLLALAIFDDLMAIVVIALGYSQGIDMTYLGLSAGLSLLLFVMNRMKVSNLVAYFLVGFVLWVFMVKSGVHATLSGVVLAFAIPYKLEDGRSPLKDIAHSMHEFVAFFIIPLFTICNAGVYLLDIGLDAFSNLVTVGIIAGLLLGKGIGIFGMAVLMIKCKFVKMPEGVDFPMLLGMSVMGGIGFTMALFIGGLSGIDPVAYKLGVIVASLLAVIIGCTILHFSLPKKEMLTSSST